MSGQYTYVSTHARKHRHQRWFIAVVAVACCALATTVALARTSDTGSDSGSSTSPSPAELADTFFTNYVHADGEVVRTDQGGDVVSEGEAYALVLADLSGRTGIARSVWQWTAAHLQRPDKLISWHADGQGHILDQQSAADADVLLAYGLLDYRGANQTSMAAAGKQIATAVLTNETTTVNGRLTLVAGPWATQSATVDPSYLMPSIFRSLATMTGDQRWQTLASTSVQQLAQLTQNGSQLPPDWARADNDRLVATGAPGTSGQPQYGMDAERSPVWLTIDCSGLGRRIAAGWWSVLHTESSAMTRSLDGTVTNSTRVPLADVGAAAAAQAGGHRTEARSALNDSVNLASANHTYYGDAWAALGAYLLAQPPATC